MTYSLEGMKSKIDEYISSSVIAAGFDIPFIVDSLLGVLVLEMNDRNKPLRPLYANPAFFDIVELNNEKAISEATNKMFCWLNEGEAYGALIDSISNRREIKISFDGKKEDGYRFYMDLLSFPLKSGDYDTDLSICLFEDMTAKKMAEEILFRKDNLLETVSKATSILLSTGRIEDNIDSALRILGEGGIADRIYVFRNHPHDPTGVPAVSQEFEWCRPGIEPQIDNPALQNLPWIEAGYERWYRELTNNGHIIGPIESFPPQEQEVLREQSIVSLLIVPVFVESKFWGMTGFDDCTYKREWSRSEIDLLRTMASSIGGAIRLKEAESNLKKAIIQAQESSKAKTEFLAHMSHEIRTPMNAVLGMAELLSETKLDPEQRKYIYTLSNAARNLLALIDDVLDISKIEAGKIELNDIPFDLATLMEEIEAMFSLKAKQKGLILEVTIDPHCPKRLIGDPDRIRQVLVNLVGNAMKFTSEGSVLIEISGKKTGGHAIINFTVKDTGIGISGEHLDRLFEKFSQADNSINRRYGGTGLGLAICKAIVEISGGKISVSSLPGKGSAFSFDMRLGIDRRGSSRKSGGSFAEKTVVLVNGTNQSKETEGILRERFGKVLLAYSLEETCDISHNEKVSAVIVDGIEEKELGRIVDCSRLSGLPVLFLLEKEPKERLSEKQTYIFKPYERSRLLKTLDYLLTASGAVYGPEKDRFMEKRTDSVKRILLVDDSTDNRLLIKAYLKKQPFEVIEAVNGSEAVELFAKDNYDLVLMDIQMPVLDGYSATMEIRELERSKGKNRTPVLALTAHAYARDIQKSLDAGCDDHLTKPIRKRELLEKLGEYLKEDVHGEDNSYGRS